MVLQPQQTVFMKLVVGGGIYETCVGGGSGLLVGLAKEGKLNNSTDNWDVLLLTILAAAVWFGWKKYMKRKAGQRN